MAWNHWQDISPHGYTCGYCGKVVASNKGYYHHSGIQHGAVYLCPNCDRPTYIVRDSQVPGAAPGNEVSGLPKDIDALYDEARQSIGVGAHTAAVLTCRKLLMNIAVGLGAPQGKKFIEYVEYLASNGYVPPNGKTWVDHIRKKGNEATHEIVLMSKADSSDLISFTEMLLKFIYEFPSRVPPPTP